MRIAFIGLVILLSALSSHSADRLDGDFEQGGKVDDIFTPDGWTIDSEHGSVVEPGYESKHALLVRGNGGNDAAWISIPLPVEPGQYYEFSFRAKTGPDTSGGSAVSGPTFANHDYWLGQEWKQYAFVFKVPSGQTEIRCRLGQWRVKGTLLFDGANLAPVNPIHSQRGNLSLGLGERIDKTKYSATHELDDQGSNSCRFLDDFTAHFNSNRWLIDPSASITYRHELPGASFKQAKVRINLNYHTAGSCVIEAKTDRKDWTILGELSDTNQADLKIPSDLLPAKTIFIRIQGKADTNGQCTLQIDRYGFLSEMDTSIDPMVGDTKYLRVNQASDDFKITLRDMDDPKPGSESRFTFSIENASGKDRRIHAEFYGEGPDASSKTSHKFKLAGREKQLIDLTHTFKETGPHTIRFLFKSDNEVIYDSEMSVDIPFLYAADYGQLIEADASASVWWCPATYKIARSRPVPKKMGRCVTLSAARGEYEPVQIVLYPQQKITGLTVTADSLRGPSGSVIDKENISIKQVEYIYNHHPSDALGRIGWWPDPLPPVEDSLSLEPGRNYPFWITVKVPRSAHSGAYQGNVAFKAGDWELSVPLEMKIYNFEIPQKFSLPTAFGFDPSLLRQYHYLDTREELCEVADLYFQNFREHRISPYNPTLLQPIRHTLKDTFVFDFSEFDKAGERYFDEFGFTTLRLPLVGMGGGTFHSRHKGKIGEFEQGTPQHEKLFHDYTNAIESHLREKGWLDKAFVYWFDEPEEKDYEFVKEGMDMIHRNAPGLNRFLTEEPGSELAGSVDIWCPVLSNFDLEKARERQAKGERIWWYICTGPKEPYPGLFIDHHAIDLRIWLWMTHQYDVQGCLVWQSNYWTSEAAFPPPALQDPWEDPMSYVSGYSRPPGYIGYWGNGDGRFYYPPPHWKEGKKTISGPVDSIRWELLREGIEDYEYFHLIKTMLEENKLTRSQKRRAEKLLDVPETISRSLSDYAKDPTALYRHRAKLASFIENVLK